MEDFFTVASRMKILFPERATEQKIGDWEVQMMKEILRKYRRDRVWIPFAQRAVDMKILLPPAVFITMVSDDDWRGMKSVLKAEIEEGRRGGGWYVYFDLAANMKMLFPERVAELGINGVIWRKLKEAFEEYRNSNMGTFLLQAFALKILAAHKVELTEKGMEVTMHDPTEEFREKHAPRPTRLSF